MEAADRKGKATGARSGPGTVELASRLGLEGQEKPQEAESAKVLKCPGIPLYHIFIPYEKTDSDSIQNETKCDFSNSEHPLFCYF